MLWRKENGHFNFGFIMQFQERLYVLFIGNFVAFWSNGRYVKKLLFSYCNFNILIGFYIIFGISGQTI